MTLARHLMPAEWRLHTNTIMAWPNCGSQSYWPPGNLEDIKRDVINVALAISRFEPVTLFVSHSQAREARHELLKVGDAIDIVPLDDVDEMKPWMRDIAPTFIHVYDSSGRASCCGIDFHFNGWGGKDATTSHSNLASQILAHFDIPCFKTSTVCEGGALETDGEGTLLVTESSLVNSNRNPDKNREAIEKELKRALGVSTVIWLPGVQNADTTDCHIDALARFAGPTMVVLSRPASTRQKVWIEAYEEAKRVLANARDAKGRRLLVVDVPEPDISSLKDAHPEMIPSYVNYFHAAGSVIIPQFGSPNTDAAAVSILGELFPEKEIVPVYIHGLPNAGGGLHCITQQIPALD